MYTMYTIQNNLNEKWVLYLIYWQNIFEWNILDPAKQENNWISRQLAQLTDEGFNQRQFISITPYIYRGGL